MRLGSGMVSRRSLLDRAARIGILAWLGTVVEGLWRGPTAHAAADERTLRICLDTLIPDDASGPGALQLGIDERVAAAAAADSAYGTVLDNFCQWLDEQARAQGGPSFADLALEQREAVIQAAESADPNSLPHRAFQRIRYDTYTHYYADARSWPGIGYRGPPQPNGFPDYSQPPQEP